MEGQFELPVALVIWVAVAVVGLLEVIKRLPKNKHLSSWLWATLSVVLCCGYLAASQYVGYWVVYAGVAIAFVKFGHAIIVKGIIGFIGQAVGSVVKVKEETVTTTETTATTVDNPTQGQQG